MMRTKGAGTRGKRSRKMLGIVMYLLLFSFVKGDGRCDLQSCVACSTAGCWFCGVGNEMQCVPQQHNCPNGSAFVLPPSTKELCPSTTTISPSTKAPPTASSILTFILTVAVSVMVGFALSVVLVAFWFNRMNDRVRAMQNRPVDGTPAIPAYKRLEEAVGRGDIAVTRGRESVVDFADDEEITLYEYPHSCVTEMTLIEEEDGGAETQF